MFPFNESRGDMLIDMRCFISDNACSKTYPSFHGHLTAPQRASALYKTKTLHKSAGGPQIIQYLSEYKEKQPEGGRTDRGGQADLKLVHN